MPNHYQRALFDAMRADGIDLGVAYYERVPADRVALGWSPKTDLPPGERYVPKSLDSLALWLDWRERVHVTPGYAGQFNIALARRLSREGVGWVHWSERAHSGVRAKLIFPLKVAYAAMVNTYALGAFAIGQKALDDFQRWGIHPEKTSLLPYSPAATPMDGPIDEACLRFRGGRRAFLFLGGLDRRKGMDVLIEAFARAAADAVDEWSLLLVGDDRSAGEYPRRVAELGLSSRVLFRGSVKPDELPTVIRAADVLVLPSRFDGWGVVLNEAASAGLALIATTECGAADHLISRGENGYVVEAGNVASLARAMTAYARNPGLAERHGEVSRATFEDHTPQRAVESMRRAIDSWRALIQ